MQYIISKVLTNERFLASDDPLHFFVYTDECISTDDMAAIDLLGDLQEVPLTELNNADVLENGPPDLYERDFDYEVPSNTELDDDNTLRKTSSDDNGNDTFENASDRLNKADMSPHSSGNHESIGKENREDTSVNDAKKTGRSRKYRNRYSRTQNQHTGQY